MAKREITSPRERGNEEWQALTRKAKKIGNNTSGSWERKNIPEINDYKEKPRRVYRQSNQKPVITAMEKPVYEEYKKIGKEEKVEVIARKLKLTPENAGKRARSLTLKGFLVKIRRGVYRIS